jgi:6-phosphogluconolactonase/glucosamine-6-phosphate isomerase/deaminase
MDIDLTGFTAEQQQALFDLLILAMYADGHLSSVENERLQQLLLAMGHADEFARDREFDAAVTRIRPNIQTLWKAKSHAIQLAAIFTGRDQHKLVYQAVQQIMTTDQHVSTWENTLLSELRLKFRL